MSAQCVCMCICMCVFIFLHSIYIELHIFKLCIQNYHHNQDKCIHPLPTKVFMRSPFPLLLSIHRSLFLENLPAFCHLRISLHLLKFYMNYLIQYAIYLVCPVWFTVNYFKIQNFAGCINSSCIFISSTPCIDNP